MSVISGKLCDNHIYDVLYSEYEIKKKCHNINTAHHIWINDLDDLLQEMLYKIKYCNCVVDIINKKFPNYKIEKVDQVDETYWAVSPEDATGSDRSLVDCHYDSLFWFMPGKSIFYRVIVALNENNDVITIFPNENIKIKMNTGDFHGLDYNKELHCVEGTIPKGKYRILLKLHYMLIPNENDIFSSLNKYLNIIWTKGSRYFMKVSAKPSSFIEYIMSFIVNLSRVLYNNGLICIIIIYILFSNNRWIDIML
jgi:hypothetical protein